MQRKGNPSALLVGMQTGAATVENSMEFPQKTKNGTAFWSSDPTAGIVPQNPETPIQRNLCIPMFIAALFTITMCWKQPNCPSVSEWIKNCGSFTQWNTMHQKERRAPTLHDSMDGIGQYYAKWNKSLNERQMPYDLTYKWHLINKTNKQVIKIELKTWK